ncbi:MAG: nitrous oxide reductase accessory protein NosL [Verrucomicrobiae bacterium]|nr:nitrous oxide reductase accessory protein NosL [Verrucomicrobiae bacterium]
MNRQTFGHSRVLIIYANDAGSALCSLHCAAIDLAMNQGRLPAEIRVGEFNTRELIAADQAEWVIGGDRQGVMTRRAKWAFADAAAADKFIEEHGGARSDFSTALKAAYSDLCDEVESRRRKAPARP